MSIVRLTLIMLGTAAYLGLSILSWAGPLSSRRS
jgi:hypothetical protein